MIAPNYELLKKDFGYSIELINYIRLFYHRNFDLITIVDGKKHIKQELALQILTDGVTKELGYGGGAGGAKSWTGAAWEVVVVEGLLVRRTGSVLVVVNQPFERIAAHQPAAHRGSVVQRIAALLFLKLVVRRQIGVEVRRIELMRELRLHVGD